MTRITIAGASGFIGSYLIDSIKGHNLYGLSRKKRKSTEQIEWRVANLFSYQSTAKALEGTDVLLYLVHSMLPSSRLFQGNFQDTDLFLADNIANACKVNKVKQIIYVGGLVPTEFISKHLESRKEVEEILKQTGIPTTILRAGMVVGNGGSSFEMLKNLVKNLPVMVLPKWTLNKTQTIFIDDLVRVIHYSIANKKCFNRVINVVNGESLTYKSLLEQAGEHFRGKKIMLPVPINYTSFSKLWVSTFGDANYELVSPLIDSLLCSLPEADIEEDIKDLIHYRSFESMLNEVSSDKKLCKKKTITSKVNTVRSIQRLNNPYKYSAHKVANLYMSWLPVYMKNLIKVKKDGDYLRFTFLGFSLLVLHKQEDVEELTRIKFHIVGGLLSKTNDTGWLEFREVQERSLILASINDFIPSLPWYIYKYTQAIAHLKVMKDFGRFINKKRIR